MVKVYRESYDIYAIHSILFNHEGVKRGREFVTRKITDKVGEIKTALDAGHFSAITIRKYRVKRDWSDSRDFVEAFG